MPDPPQSVAINNHPLGNELRLDWVLPETLPNHYRLVIFKNNTVITDEQITDYFAGLETKVPVTFILPDGDGNMVDGIVDLNVETGQHYYYRLLIQDTESEEISETTDVDAEVTTTYQMDIIDCKEIVIQAIKRVMSSVGMIENSHYEIRRQWTPPSEKNLTIYVVRVPNEVVQRYMGDIIQDNGYNRIYGQYEQDNIEVFWEDPSHKRIDKLTNVFRNSKMMIKTYLTSKRIGSIEIVMGGDALNAAFRERPEPTASMMIHCGYEVRESFQNQVTKEIAGQEMTPSI